MSAAPSHPGERKFWIAVSAATAVVLALALAALLAVRAIYADWRLHAEAGRELARLEGKRGAVLAASSARRRLGEEERLIRSSFVNPADPLPFIEAVEALGRRFGLKVELAVGSQGSGGSAYLVRTRGSFRQVMPFFQKLESFPFLISIGDSEMRVGEEAALSGSLKSDPTVELNATILPVSP